MRRVALSLSSSVSTLLQPGHSTYLGGEEGREGGREVTYQGVFGLSKTARVSARRGTLQYGDRVVHVECYFPCKRPSNPGVTFPNILADVAAQHCFDLPNPKPQRHARPRHLAYRQNTVVSTFSLQRYSLVDVAAQHGLEGLWQEAALDHQALLAVQVAAGAQLGQQVLADVLVLAVHGLAQVHEVGEHRLLGAFAGNLGARGSVQ